MTRTDDPWNDFIARAEVALGENEDLAPLHALWVYQGQVCNGGHHQFFQNLHDQPEVFSSALEGARKIGATEIAQNLEAAIEVWRSKPRERFKNAVDFIESARAGEWDDFDDRFSELETEFQRAFEAAVSSGLED